MEMRSEREVLSSAFFRSQLPFQHTHEMLPSWTFSQVRKARKLVIAIVYISILCSSTALGFPRKPVSRITEHRNKITVATSGCRPLTTEQLKARLGGAYNPETMAFEGDGIKRTMSDSAQSVIGGNAAGDDDDDEIDDIFEDEEDIEENSDNTVSVQSRKYMRRKRDSENTNTLSNDGFLYINLAYDKIAKRKSRKKRGARDKKYHTPWECAMQSKWIKMKKGYFPTHLYDGTCVSKTCFFGIYDCRPVKYAIKVLKRDPKEVCNPVPLIGQNTTYEESWVFKRNHVTVACECVQSSSSRKRNRKRS